MNTTIRADELKRFDVTDQGKIVRISHWITCVAVWFEDGTMTVYKNPERLTVEREEVMPKTLSE
jgi:hypothetical protein